MLRAGYPQSNALVSGTRVTNGGRNEDGVFIEVETEGRVERIEGDYVLVSVGRRPSLTGVDAAALGLAVGKRGEQQHVESLRR